MNNVEVPNTTSSPSMKIQFTKMLLAATAAFVASKLVENGFDKVVVRQSNKVSEG